MKLIRSNKIMSQSLPGIAVLVATLVLMFSGSGTIALAHGGEDHGDQQAAPTIKNGMISRSARLGEFEVLIKHALLEPDTATSARLFVTQFETNEPVGDAGISLEVESANGMVTEVPVEKSDIAGTYIVTVPALAEGSYTVRARLNPKGKVETATFSGVEVGAKQASSPSAAGFSWTQTALTSLLLLVGLVLFGGLIFLAFRAVNGKQISKEAVTA